MQKEKDDLKKKKRPALVVEENAIGQMDDGHSGCQKK